jgi:hypothetical protein
LRTAALNLILTIAKRLERPQQMRRGLGTQ